MFTKIAGAVLVGSLLLAAPSYAEMQPLSFKNYDYRVTQNDVNGKKGISGNTLKGSSAQAGFGQNCTVMVGSIVTDKPIYGDVNLNVNIRDGVSVQCGRF